MSIQKNHILALIILLVFCNVKAQDSLQTVTAKNGDGIFSVLRDQGMDVVKYYSDFVNLNESKIKDGSYLIIGEDYLVPHAPDSFKNMGIKIQLPNKKERPIFEGELGSLIRIDSSLQHTVYYLITDNGVNGLSKKPQDEIAMRMARKLIQRCARVYMLNNPTNDSLDLIDFTSEVNKRYLKHTGDYQRLLVIKTDNILANKKTNVSVYHYAESKEGKKMADNILKIIDKSSIKHMSVEDYSKVFTDFKDVSFAKNILPAITFIEMGTEISQNEKSFQISSNKKRIADLITNGLLSDYSKLDFEDN